MAPDSAVRAGAFAERDVMASVDEGRLLIADVDRDGAWLGMPADEAPVLAEHR
jgi:hypothetical protein